METRKKRGLTPRRQAILTYYGPAKRSRRNLPAPHLLLQINPPIWRRLHVRSDSSIATLHELLQIAFDWSDFHLHRFVIRGKEYGLSRMGCTTFAADARKVLLSQFHFRVNERFLYEYDFGDLWRHQIRFEEAVDRLEAYERFRPGRFDRRKLNRRLKQYAQGDEEWLWE